MPIDNGPYKDRAIAFATMHGKETAVAKAFARRLSASIKVPSGIDTDALGTFTGEIPRAGTILDAARSKARLAIDATGLRYGLGSEGSFGPHPHLPFLPRATEVLLFADQERGIEVVETLVTYRTNYQHCSCRAGDDISGFLKSARFPHHALVVTPTVSATELPPVKGIRSFAELSEAIVKTARLSSDQTVRIVTDMRAHLNPTRMAVIRALAFRLARRLATPCPRCATPGFGIVEIARGLPCGWCGEPTQIAVAEVRRCAKCSFETRTGIKGVPATADPGNCQKCNP